MSNYSSIEFSSATGVITSHSTYHTDSTSSAIMNDRCAVAQSVCHAPVASQSAAGVKVQIFRPRAPPLDIIRIRCSAAHYLCKNLYFEKKTLAFYRKRFFLNYLKNIAKKGKICIFSFFNGAAPPEDINKMSSN